MSLGVMGMYHNLFQCPTALEVWLHIYSHFLTSFVPGNIALQDYGICIQMRQLWKALLLLLCKMELSGIYEACIPE